jgi:hypothetical protein
MLRLTQKMKTSLRIKCGHGGAKVILDNLINYFCLLFYLGQPRLESPSISRPKVLLLKARSQTTDSGIQQNIGWTKNQKSHKN